MNEEVSTKPGVLSPEEVNKLLSMTLIANLGAGCGTVICKLCLKEPIDCRCDDKDYCCNQ